jgi:hypothetical protein
LNKYDELFKAYVAELREAKENAEVWWDQLVVDDSHENVNLLSIKERWPFGATSHPWVIAVYRKYYLLCDELNKEFERNIAEIDEKRADDVEWGEDDDSDDDTIDLPRAFVIDKLNSDDNMDLYNFILSMVFVPIGLKDDEYV